MTPSTQDGGRWVAVTTATRSERLQGIPTMSEFLPGYEASQWYGLGVTKNAPTEIIDRLNKEINAGLADAKMKARFADLGGTVLPGSPPAPTSSLPKPILGPTSPTSPPP